MTNGHCSSGELQTDGDIRSYRDDSGAHHAPKRLIRALRKGKTHSLPLSVAPINSVMNNPSHGLSNSVAETLSNIRELYSAYFDRSELTTALRDFPMEPRGYQDIRHALSLSSPTVWDLPVLHRGLDALKVYIRLLRLFVLPRSEQKLGFSFLGEPGFKENTDSRVQRRLLLYALPMNLDQLTKQVQELDDILPPIPTVMPSFTARQTEFSAL